MAMVTAVRRHGPALLAYVLLAVAYTWPLVTHLGTVVARDLGDPLLSTWALWWNSQVLPFSAAWWNGPIFAPAAGTLALSDHRVGLSLFTSPLIWSGVSPLAAYNAVFLATFVCSAWAAYALALSLTGRRAAAFLGGLVFGFHPFRAAHLEHLELLASFWLPLVVWSLHRWHERRTIGWLVVLAATLTAQALTSGYYFFFAGVLVAAWLVWFEARLITRGEAARLAVALLVPLVVVAPILWRYREIHAVYGLTRTITDIELFSADLADFFTAPAMLAWWRSAPGPIAERALFPGVTALLLVLVTVARSWRPSDPAAADERPWSWLPRVRRGLLTLGVVAAGAALLAAAVGGVALPWLSIRAPYKPLSVAALLVGGWALTAPRLRQSWRRTSPLAFYVLATCGLWLLALGPTARLFGERVFYKAPYAWLMVLPGFSDSFRAPARFAMIAALTLAMAAALAMSRWPVPLLPPGRRAPWLVVLALALLDGWILPLPLPAPPAPLVVPAGLDARTVVLEVPLGVYADAAAMYRGIGHGHPVGNGLSGYDPAHYAVLRAALDDGDLDVLTQLPSPAGITVVVALTAPGRTLAGQLRAVPWATAQALPAGAAHAVFSVPARAATPAPAAAALELAAVAAHPGASSSAMRDGNVRTAWVTPAEQSGGETVDLDLGAVTEVGHVTLRQGPYPFAYPRDLSVELSLDGQTWREAWRGRPAAAAMAGALADPASAPVVLTFAPAPARFVRLTQRGRAAHPWAIAEIEVGGEPR